MNYSVQNAHITAATSLHDIAWLTGHEQ